MTKKSESRKTRDQIKKAGACWEDLEQLRTQLASQFSLFSVIESFCKNDQLMAFVEDQEQLNKDIQTLASDITKIGNEMGQIWDAHRGLTGKIIETEDYFKLIRIGEAYIKQSMIVEASILPTFQNIMGIFHVAEEKLQKSVMEAAAVTETPQVEETPQA